MSEKIPLKAIRIDTISISTLTLIPGTMPLVGHLHTAPEFHQQEKTQVEADTAAKKEGARLPTNYTVQTYKYKQTPNFEDFTFAGEESIVMTVTQPSEELTLNSLGLDIQSAQFKTEDGQLYPAHVSYNKEEERVTFGFDNKLEGNGELELSFAGDLKNDKGDIKGEMNGTYLSQWKDEEGNTHYWATSDYEPSFARQSLVLADEPERKAVFEVTLVSPKGWEAISNMPRQNVYREGDHDVHVFEPTPKMSSYLLAHIVGEFDSIEGRDSNGVLHRVVTTPGKREQGQMALEASMEMLPFYVEWTGIPFPLPKLDNVAVRDFGPGAMENWGLITARETNLLVHPNESSQESKERVVETVAHEDAHMWFGNLVSPKWWTYLWLNESFATYMSSIAVNHVHPEWKVWDNFINNQQNPALEVDALNNTHPIEVEVNHPKEVGEIFDTISYQKGCSILDMLSHFIGAENFRLGTADYLNKFAHSSATTQDLLQSYEERSGLPVREMMENWLFKPGHPVIVVKDNGDHFELTQERFFISEKSRKQSQDTTLWQIPLLVRGETSPYLMKDKTMNLQKPGEGEWFLLNEGANSFVRISYPESVLNSLREPIEKQLISPADRYSLVRDVFDLAQAGMSSIDKALAFVESYKNETNFAVWSVIAEKLANVSNIIDGENPEIQEKFNVFAGSIFKGIGEKVGWDKKPGESNNDTLLRELVIDALGQFGDKETIRTAQEKFAAHIAGKTPLDPDLRSSVYKIIAANGEAKDYEALMDLYKKTNMQEEKRRILFALGGFKDPELTQKSLHFALFGDGEESAPKSEAFRLMFSLFNNPHSREKAWEFTKEHWDKILEIYGDGQLLLPRFITPVEAFHSGEKAHDVEEFFKTHKAPGAQRTIQQTAEMITSKADWLARDREKIVNFLKKAA